MLLCGHSEEIAAWVMARVPNVTDFGLCEALGVESAGRLIAGVVYHSYQPSFRTIELSMAADSPMWARRGNIAGLLSYPFDQLNVFKIWTLTPMDNEPALKVNRHIGFKREAILAHHYGPKRHGIVCRMLKPDYERLYGASHG